MSHETQVHDAAFKGSDSVSPVRVCLQVAAKELQLFLASPIAWLCLNGCRYCSSYLAAR